jgi:ADP-ribose pyrophosphatase
MNTKAKLENWSVIESRTLLSAPPYLDVRAERVALPDGRVVEDYYQVDITPFVCVFAEAGAETGDNKILVIRQYKHGAKQVSLTFPGGHIDAGEAPLDAARRELLEETGFAAGRWLSLGGYVINANQGCGMAHLFVAKQCRKVSQPDSGDLEAMEIMLLSRAEIFAAARRGDFVLLNQIALFSLATHPELLEAVAAEAG